MLKNDNSQRDDGKILFICNDPQDITVIRGHLDQQDYKVIDVKSGQEALDIVKEDPPDTIIINDVLTDMDGVDLCRYFKSKEDIKEIPLIMVSSRDDKKKLTQILDAGADDFILKPKPLLSSTKIKEHLFASVTSPTYSTMICIISMALNVDDRALVISSVTSRSGLISCTSTKCRLFCK